jgi:hypothetical protein
MSTEYNKACTFVGQSLTVTDYFYYSFFSTFQFPGSATPVYKNEAIFQQFWLFLMQSVTHHNV